MKKPPRERGLGDINVAATYFSTCVPGSIIGPLELNCRVRDGNGCDLQGIATTKGTKTKGVKRRSQAAGERYAGLARNLID